MLGTVQINNKVDSLCPKVYIFIVVVVTTTTIATCITVANGSPVLVQEIIVLNIVQAQN